MQVMFSIVTFAMLRLVIKAPWKTIVELFITRERGTFTAPPVVSVLLVNPTYKNTW